MQQRCYDQGGVIKRLVLSEDRGIFQRRKFLKSSKTQPSKTYIDHAQVHASTTEQGSEIT